MRRRDFLHTLMGSFAALNVQFSLDKPGIFPYSSKKETSETDILVKLLGTAQDGGLPHFGCYCKNCFRARENPQFARLISSLAVMDIGERKFWLVDATPDIRAQWDIIHQRLAQEKSGSQNSSYAILLTHAHIGHYTGLMFFGYEAMNARQVPVYCSARMRDFLANNGPWSQLVNLGNIAPRILSPDKELSLLPQLSITPLPVPHRDEYSDTLGFIISGRKKKLLYIPDIQNWEAWSRSIVSEVNKVNIALLDGTFFGPEELPGRDISQIGHPFIQSSLKTLSEVVRKGESEIYFTHLNHTNLALDPEGEARKKIEAQGLRLAEEGMEFFL
ncbi:MAG: MBL fold metallo-hydrolase [Acidobacteriota bacterium]